MPFPVAHLRRILSVFRNILLVLHQLVAHLLQQMGSLVSKLGQVIDHRLHQMIAVNFILHAHIERRGNRPFLLIAVHMQVPVGTVIGQLMDHGRIAMERKYDRFILRKQRIIIRIAQAMRDAGMRTAASSGQIPFTTRIFSSGMASCRMVTAASVSSVGVSPAQAITTSGSAPWSLLAPPRFPRPGCSASPPAPWSATAAWDAWRSQAHSHNFCF